MKMESWRPKYRKSGKYSKSKCNAPCKKHPKHSQSPGVCSICLREKLAQLSTNSSSSRSKILSSSSSSSSYLSSLSSSSNLSSYSSPVNGISFRMASVGRRPMSSLKSTGKDMLNKNRSMGFVLQRRKDENNGKNKSGFWSKLLHPRKKGLMHSRTVRETAGHYCSSLREEDT